GHLPAPPRGSRRLRAARLRLRGTLLGPGSRSFVELRLVRLVAPHLDTREDVDAPVVDRALEEEGDVAPEAAGGRLAPPGGQEPRVERLLGGGARALVRLGGEAPGLHVLARLADVVESEPQLAGGERHSAGGQ